MVLSFCFLLMHIGVGSQAQFRETITQPRPIDQKLFDAIRVGSVTKVKAALKGKANPNAIESNDWTPLMQLTKPDGVDTRVEIASLLIAAGAKVNYRQRDAQGWTPLTNALNGYRGSIALVKFLLSKGANPNLAAGDGMTPLHFAVRHQSPELVELLLKAGANVNGRTKRSPQIEVPPELSGGGESVEAHNQSVMDAMFEPGFQYRMGETPMMTLSWSPAVAKLLLKAGAKIDDADDNGWTALHFAAAFGNEIAVRGLVELGASVNKKSKGGTTPLHAAMILGGWGQIGPNPDTYRFLIAKGADKLAKTDQGWTPVGVLRNRAETFIRESSMKPSEALTSDNELKLVAMVNKVAEELEPGGAAMVLASPPTDEFGRRFYPLEFGDVSFDRSVRVEGDVAVLSLRCAPQKSAKTIRVKEIKLQEMESLTQLPAELKIRAGKKEIFEFRFPKVAGDGGAVRMEWEEVVTNGSSSGMLGEGRFGNPQFVRVAGAVGVAIEADMPNRTMEFCIDRIEKGSAREKDLVGKVLVVEVGKPLPVLDSFGRGVKIKYRFRYVPNKAWVKREMVLYGEGVARG